MVIKKVVKRIKELKGSLQSKRLVLHNNPRLPAFIETAPAIVMGQPSERQLIAFRTPFCTHGKCTMCGFNLGGVQKVDFDDLKAQFDSIDLINKGRVSLCTESSFFHPGVPFSFLEFLFRKIAKTKIQEIDLETCASDIINNIENIGKLKALLRKDQQLFVGVGLESQDDFVRSVLIGKNLSKELFEKAVKLLAYVDVGIYAYIMLKPPGLKEKEAIKECILTLRYFFRIMKKNKIIHSRATLKPLFIPENTIVEKLFEEGLITPPKLWSLIEVLIKTHKLGNIFVPLTDEGLAKGRLAENCKKCTDKIRETIKIFDANQNIKPLQLLSCECKEK